VNLTSQTLFFLMAAVPLFLLLIWSAGRIRTAAEYYAAGREYGGIRNGLAITGDYLSAASFLGITGLIVTSGYSGILYAVGFFAGWPLILILLADKLRSIGHFTLADVLRERFADRRIVLVATVGYFPVVVIYLAAQFVAMAWLLNYLFGISYDSALATLAVVAIITGLTGRMIFSSRAQIIKAILVFTVMGLLTLLAYLTTTPPLPELFSVDEVLIRLPVDVHFLPQEGDTPMALLSLGVALILGPVGLPHVMSRFFSVSDERHARMSVFYATGLIGGFYILIILLGFLAIQHLEASPWGATGTANLAAVYLSDLVGGEVLSGVLAAVLMVVLFSVMTSLILTGSSAFSHDWYALTLRPSGGYQEERRLHRLSGLVTVVTASAFALLCREQNVAYLVGLAFAFSASVSVPLLLGALYWERLTAQAALWGGVAGLLSALFALMTGPLVWVGWFGFSEPVFPWRHPALLSVSIAVVVMWYFSRKEVRNVTEGGAAGEHTD